MTDTENFNLKWNDFHSNASSSFRNLRNESYLHDVTLVSEDFKHVQAHKLVLSACSEYFRHVFQQAKHSQPLLCLDGVSSSDLQRILDYVYEGEAKVHQDELEKFLSLAQRLKLEGLLSSGSESNVDDIYYPHNDFKSVDTFEFNNSYVKVKSKEVESCQILESKPRTHHMAVVKNNPESQDFKQVEKLDENIVVGADGRTLSCGICSKTLSRPYSKHEMRRHVESHLKNELSYTCNLCGNTFRSSNSLKTHKTAFHK